MQGQSAVCGAVGEADATDLVEEVGEIEPGQLVNSLKDVSPRTLRQDLPDLARHSPPANRLWSGSCFAGYAGSAPISVLRQYIEQQAPA